MLTIQLKEKHICYVAEFMIKPENAGRYWKLTNMVSSVLNADSYGPDDLVEIEIDLQDLLDIHQALGNREEFYFGTINQEMKALLLARLAQLANAGNADAISAGIEIQKRITDADAALNVWIGQGRLKLMQ